MNKAPMTPVIKGLIISAILIAFSVVVIKLGMDSNPELRIYPLAILFGGTLFASIFFAKEMDGNVSFMEVFVHGFKMTAFVAAIMGFWLLISLKLIFPDVLNHSMDMMKADMIKKGQTAEEADRYLAGYKNGAVAMGTIINVVFQLIIGALGSLAGAAFTKKNPDYKPIQKSR